MEAKGEEMKSVLRWCVVPLLATSLVAQTAAKPKPRKSSSKAATITAQDVQELRDALAAQQQQIQQLQQQMQSRDAALQQAAQQAQQQLQQTQAAATDAQQKAASAELLANSQKDTVDKLNNNMQDVQTTLTIPPSA